MVVTQTAYGGLVIAAGATAMSLTTTPLAVAWTGKSAADSNGAADGDPAVVPDLANNRVKINTPGVYKVSCDIEGVGGGTGDVELAIRLNGTAKADLKSRFGMSTARAGCSLVGILNVLRSDSPGTLPTFADPTSSFGGIGGAPKTLTTV